jgi:5-formyltetrahydrofolate cyclo-ligase
MMGEEHAHEKRLVRRRIQARRARLSANDVVRLSAAACTRIALLPIFAAARHLVLYAPLGNELDPGGLVDSAIRSAKMLYYPRAEDGGVEFHRGEEQLRSDGGCGLPTAATLDRSADAVLFLVPGVAFDPQGARLGRGDGWYDRAFARYPGGVRLGLAYEFQVLPSLPEAPWDVRMHAVVTEARVIPAAPGTVLCKETPR